MKKIVSKLVLLSLLVVLMMPISVKALTPPTIGTPSPFSSPSLGEGNQLQYGSEITPPAPGKPVIPDTFNVNEYLTTDGQTPLVPHQPTGGELGTQNSPESQSGVIIILLKAIDLFVKIIGSIALIVFILGAILTITSEGKEDRLEKGKTAMVYALIGLVITFFSFIIVAFVQSILF